MRITPLNPSDLPFLGAERRSHCGVERDAVEFSEEEEGGCYIRESLETSVSVVVRDCGVQTLALGDGPDGEEAVEKEPFHQPSSPTEEEEDDEVLLDLLYSPELDSYYDPKSGSS